MSIEKGRAYFRALGIEDRVMEFDVSSATVELAAQAVGCQEAMIAKTLSFKIGNGGILIVAAGDARIDNRKFKDKFHVKAKMLSHEQAAELVGHAVGGVCPFGVNPGVKTYMDECLRRFEIVYPAAGTSNSAVRLTPEELYRASEAVEWVDVCKLPEAEG